MNILRQKNVIFDEKVKLLMQQQQYQKCIDAKLKIYTF